jgi:hypothetical protein
MLDNVNGLSSLAASRSTVVVLLKGWIDTATANEVCWDPIYVGCHLVAFLRAKI